MRFVRTVRALFGPERKKDQPHSSSEAWADTEPVLQASSDEDNRERGEVTAVKAREITGVLRNPPESSPRTVTLQINDVQVDRVEVPVHESGLGHFRFPVRDMWRYCGPEDKVTVRIDDQCLPMPNGDDHYIPLSAPREPLSELVKRLDAGEIVNSKGLIALPKYLDTQWQRVSSELYGSLREALQSSFGYEPFLIYGSLLGAVREGRPLGHDYDFDIAFLSRHTEPRLVQEEIGQIAIELQTRGFAVEARVTCLHIASGDRTQRIDLYHTYFDENGELRLAWGQASDVPFWREQWDGLEPTEFCGTEVMIPRNSEKLVEALYGPDWRVPNPGFSWENQRSRVAREIVFPPALAASLNWEDYWASRRFDSPSSFASFIIRFSGVPASVIDLGCGDGRDTPLFIREGSRVLGLDSSRTGIASARERRLDFDYARFEVMDLSAQDALIELTETRANLASPVLFYSRQLLDALQEAATEHLLVGAVRSMSPGDSIALEFRGLNDTTLTPHEKWSCGRRTVDALKVRHLLERAGAKIVFDAESNEWEKRGKEGVQLHRIVASIKRDG